MRIGKSKLVRMAALALAVWAAAVATSHGAQILTVGEHAALPAGEVRVPVQMADATGVATTAFIVNFDPDLLALSNVTTGGLGATFALEYKLEEGRVAVALVRDEALTAGAGTLVYLHFIVNGGAVAGMTAPLALADGTASGQHAVDLAWRQSVVHSNGVVHVVSRTQDSNGNGLPDWWEEFYFEGPTYANAAADSDGDGMTNGQEYQLSRHPLVADNAWLMGGFVRTPGGAGVGGVAVGGLAGPPSTASDGSYSATFTYGWSGSSTPGKTTDSPPARGVTSVDLALIQRHILFKGRFDSPYKLLAADANGSGSVTAVDLALIQRLILVKTNTLPAGLWRFVPANYVFLLPESPWDAPTNRSCTNLLADLPGADFVAIKRGDVNNSWTPPPAQGLAANDEPPERTDGFEVGPTVRFQVSTHAARPGQTVTAKVTVSGFDRVSSAQFGFEWDPAVLQCLNTGGYALGGLSAASFGTNLTESGRLACSWYDPEVRGVSVQDGTAIFTVSFRVVGKAGSVSRLVLGDAPTIREVGVNFAVATFGQRDGWVSVVEKVMVRLSEPSYSQGVFRVSVPTESGQRYTLEFTDSLPATDWAALPAVAGDGTVMILSDSAATNGQRFYRVRIE